VLSLRMHGAIPSLPQCIFMAWYLFKHGYSIVAWYLLKYRDNFTFIFF